MHIVFVSTLQLSPIIIPNILLNFLTRIMYSFLDSSSTRFPSHFNLQDQ